MNDGENYKGQIFEPTLNSDNPASNLLSSSPPSGTLRTYNMIFLVKMTLMAAIGGFLFGYDTGVIGGADLYLHIDFPDITAGQKEMIVSLAVIGAAVGCVLIGPVSDNYGRKISIIISDILFTIGAIIVFIVFFYFYLNIIDACHKWDSYAYGRSLHCWSNKIS